MSTPNRTLELAQQLQDIESKKALFTAQMKAVASQYFKKGTLTFTTETADFNDKGTTEAIEFDKELLSAYLNAEIARLKTQSDRIISELAGG